MQIAGALIVLSGVATAAWPADGGSNVFTEVCLAMAIPSCIVHNTKVNRLQDNWGPWVAR